MVFKFPKSICRFCKHHRRKFIFAGVFIGGVYGAIKFAEYKIKGHIVQEQYNMSEKIKVEKCFDTMQLHSFSIISAMLDKLLISVKQEANCEEITEKLKARCGDKIELWHQLKLMVFTQLITGLCSVVLISLTLKVQLNQVAGTFPNLSSKLDDAIDPKQQNFLSIIHDYFFESGVHSLAQAIKNVVYDQLHSLPLQATYNYQDLQSSMLCVCSTLFQRSPQQLNIKLSQFAMGKQLLIEEANSLQNDIAEWLAKTADILESPDAQTVFNTCLEKGFSVIGKQMDFHLRKAIESKNVGHVDTATPLAKLLPLLNTQLTYVCSEVFLEEICEVPVLNTFLFHVFESCLHAL